MKIFLVRTRFDEPTFWLADQDDADFRRDLRVEGYTEPTEVRPVTETEMRRIEFFEAAARLFRRGVLTPLKSL